MQFLVFGLEIHCETTATRKVTVKPLRYISLKELSLIYIFSSDAMGGRGIKLIRAKHATE